MNQFTTQAIVLTRTNYGEADRILTLLTPDYGKLRLMARGVRKVQSKLAGGIELFSVSHISFIRGRGEIGTLTSTRLSQHYGQILKDIERTTAGYDLIKQLHRATEDQPEAEYFRLLEQAFTALNDYDISPELTRLWFAMQLLKLGGHTPNLQIDQNGQPLEADAKYTFDIEKGSLVRAVNGKLSAAHIKFLRLGFTSNDLKVLVRVTNADRLIAACSPFMNGMFTYFVLPRIK